jgi:hypothetical protein
MSKAFLWTFAAVVSGVLVFLVIKNKSTTPPPNPPPSPSAPTAYYYCSDPLQKQCSVSAVPIACSPSHADPCLTQAECLLYCQPPSVHHWGCEYVRSGDRTSARTGRCIEYADASMGIYPDKASCENAHVCTLPQYFDCTSRTGGPVCVDCTESNSSNCAYGPTNPPGDLSEWERCLTACKSPPSPPTCNPPCDAGSCQVCVNGRCVDSCVSASTDICPDGNTCPYSSTTCSGLWCPGATPSTWTPCPAAGGQCSDGKPCRTVPCHNRDCGYCDKTKGECKVDRTLCSAGFTCVCPSGKTWPSSECHSEPSPPCPAGYNIAVSPYYTCPQYKVTDREYFCPTQNYLTGANGTCKDGTPCVACSDASVPPHIPGLGCCTCCPNDICTPMNVAKSSSSQEDNYWL